VTNNQRISVCSFIVNLTSHKTSNRLWLINVHSSAVTPDDTKPPHQPTYMERAC